MDLQIKTPTGFITRHADLNFFLLKNIFTKNSMHANFLRSVLETNYKCCGEIDKQRVWFLLLWYTKNVFNGNELYNRDRTLARLLTFDMIGLYKMWRHVRGYPSNGQRTWSNGKSATKNNTLLKSYRLEQMHNLYGTKKRTNFQVLIQAEYNNKLWMKTWLSEWLQARKTCVKLKHAKTKAINIDIGSLASGITSGYKRKGKAARLNKAKKALKIVTIGVPIFFTRYIFTNSYTKKFPHKIGIQLQERKYKSKKSKKKVVTKQKTKKTKK